MAANRIHPRATVIGDVELGTGNSIEAGCVLVGPMKAGDDNFFGPNSVIGAPAQDDRVMDALIRDGISAGSHGGLTIGSGTVVREFSTVHRGLTTATFIGDGCYLMAYSHVAHDSRISDGVKIANSVQMGGYTWVGRSAYLGLASIVHQFTVIGGHSMVGMGSVVTERTIPPGSLLYGNPARLVRPNLAGLERVGVSEARWWNDLVAGRDPDVIPSSIEADIAEYRAACENSARMRASVTEWRQSRSRGVDED